MNQWGISTSFDETVYAQMQYVWGGLLLSHMLMALAFLFGAIWSNVGLLVSVIFPNKYLALAAPFALYFSVHLIFHRTESLLVLSPVNMLMPNASFIPFTLYPLLFEILLLGIICILFNVLIKRSRLSVLYRCLIMPGELANLSPYWKALFILAVKDTLYRRW